jgi:wyosine [tRNA(Phe)-imidazoG37] synthetase (radical SAM superfamily)
VPSRRLGRSLGIDLVPFKTCSYDCVYCQLGRTTSKTVERGEYVPLDAVLEELDRRLAWGPEPDYVTLSGSGEPTLYSRLGSLMRGIKDRTDRPVAVLTNGSLLCDAEVQDALLGADLVIPSLDAGDDAVFQWVNRPHPAVSFERMAEGLEAFCQRFTKPVWLEVFLLRGLNATGVQLERIVRLVDRIAPERVQLNTATRPPIEEFARRVPADELAQAAQAFGSRAEVIAERHPRHHDDTHAMRQEDILGLLRRRPCTATDVAAGLGLHPNEVVKYLDELVREHVLVCGIRRERAFYRLAEQADGMRKPNVQVTGPEGTTGRLVDSK